MRKQALNLRSLGLTPLSLPSISHCWTWWAWVKAKVERSPSFCWPSFFIIVMKAEDER